MIPKDIKSIFFIELTSLFSLDLEENVDITKLHFEHSYAVESLSQKHQNILTKVNQHFDGKASHALMNRFIENIIQLQDMFLF
ncbi:hypothetical protein [Clostridium sp. 1xD42-85]|uniref:hypothetical protein n=1 Tax=Clostridium sp. 1xD42-85 TaxID=2320084 RepID=UPI0015FFC9B6|nr:hypothetical protein [Clostridium sp. 1xD42-85]